MKRKSVRRSGRKSRAQSASVPVPILLRELQNLYPDPQCALLHENPLQLLIATILSAQCTDKRVNLVTPELFQRYPTAQHFAAADPAELEAMIRSTGFFRNKAKNIIHCCRAIVEKHGGEVPHTMPELVELGGVGRKTANVILGNAFGIPGLVVDTHVTRLANRLGLTKQKDPVKIERELCAIIPEKQWTDFSHWLILHGRALCSARKPLCQRCVLQKHCPSALTP